MRLSASDLGGTSSGPSSSEGRPDSVFSTATRGHSSVTSEETRAPVTPSFPTESRTTSSTKARNTRARVVVPEPDPTPIKYWNEFDDGESDVNPQDSYAIYVDPNEPAFPMISKALASMKSWWPLRSVFAGQKIANERTPLLYDEETASIESSDSDALLITQQQEMRRGLVWGLVGGISVAVAVGPCGFTVCYRSAGIAGSLLHLAGVHGYRTASALGTTSAPGAACVQALS